MIFSKLKYVCRKIALSYIIAVIFVILISISLDKSIENPICAFFLLILVAVCLYLSAVISAHNLKDKINKLRLENNKPLLNEHQVELNSSITTFDLSFLLFSSWKLGETILKITDFVHETNIEGRKVIYSSEGVSLLFSLALFTAFASMYSFIKVLDKIKEYPGATIAKAKEISPVETLEKKARVRNSIAEFIISFILLVIVPAALGFYHYKYGLFSTGLLSGW